MHKRSRRASSCQALWGEIPPKTLLLLLVMAEHVHSAHHSYLTTIAGVWTGPKAHFVPLGLGQQPGPREMPVAGGVYNLCLVTESLDAHSASLHTMGSNGSGTFPRSLWMKSLHLLHPLLPDGFAGCRGSSPAPQGSSDFHVISQLPSSTSQAPAFKGCRGFLVAALAAPKCGVSSFPTRPHLCFSGPVGEGKWDCSWGRNRVSLPAPGAEGRT